MDSIKKTNFTVSNWQYELEAVNTIKSRETTQMQEAYDVESKNGRKGRTQVLWQRKVKSMIKENLL